MSTYPTSAELAAFRRRIHNTNRSEDHGLYEPCYVDDPLWDYTSARRDGIGRGRADVDWAMEARREASALRSRAYAAKGMASQWLVPVHPKSGGAWYAERVDGAPYQWHTYGRRDGIVASDTWSEDDAPRSPLPIRYQAAFVITRVEHSHERNGGY